MTAAATPVPLEGAAAEAAARSVLYAELSGALGFPSQEFHARARGGELRARLETCLDLLPEPLPGRSDLLSGLATAEPDYENFQSGYVGLFDVGAGGPPCPLVGGAWSGDRHRTMEDDLRFYRFFGVTSTDPGRQLPDHAAAELEFLHVLCFREAEVLARDGDARPLRRASRDFLLRHPVRWLPAATERLEEIGAPGFWRSLLGLAAACCDVHAKSLCRSEGAPRS